MVYNISGVSRGTFGGFYLWGPMVYNISGVIRGTFGSFYLGISWFTI